MDTAQQIHARIMIPADCLSLVTELVTRLGGNVTDDENLKISTLPEIERGGEMLRALRTRAGITQQEIADALKLPQSHICEFEKNRRAIPYKHAKKLAKILNSIPSHFMRPNAETTAVMNEAGENNDEIMDENWWSEVDAKN